MREILFRGQTRRKGERVWMDGRPVDSNWVYGGVLQGTGAFSIIYGSNDPDDMRGSNMGKHVVYTDTLGQYTNRDAANGKIFEGDILQTPQGELLVAAYAGTQFILRQLNGRARTWQHAKYYRIIGNKFDTPELLEVPDVLS